MKPTRFCTLLSLAVLCLLLTSCFDSKAPLSDASKAKRDVRLIGLWKQEHQNGVTYYHVGHLGDRAPAGMMRVLTVTQHSNGTLQEPHQLIAFRSDLGEHSYLNVVGVTKEQLDSIRQRGWKSDLLDSYIIVKYRIDDDALLVQGIEGEAKRNAIGSGKIKGEIDTKPHQFVNTHFTDTTDNLAKFVAEAGDELFSENVVRLERVK